MWSGLLSNNYPSITIGLPEGKIFVARTFLLIISGSDYREGDIRLVGGVYSWEGRVEIYLYGKWVTVRDNSADVQDAHVVCQQLGYDTRCESII